MAGNTGTTKLSIQTDGQWLMLRPMIEQLLCLVISIADGDTLTYTRARVLCV